MSVAKRFAKEIVKKRKELGETQAIAAEAVDISIRWLQSIEAGRLPGTRTALNIIAHLNICGRDLLDPLSRENGGRLLDVLPRT